MENISKKEMLSINPSKMKERQWIVFTIVLFSVAPFLLSFYLLELPSVFFDIDTIGAILILSVIFQIPILIIGMPLYYVSNKIRRPEKISDTQYEFSVKTYRTIHFFMSSLWMSGIFGTIALIICLIFKLNQVYLILGIYGYMAFRLLLMMPVYIAKRRLNR